ncbi:MAG: hypothetical protein KAG99_01055, partial [Bacteroidales bacterium]|nr:hypothetical protein [Bacteroidales bacterium]
MMQLLEIGQLANKYWDEIPVHFPFVELGAYIVMPNHVHGIVVINKPNNGRNGVNPNVRNVGNGENVGDCDDVGNDGNGDFGGGGDDVGDGDNVGNGDNVETQNFASLRRRRRQRPPPQPKNKFGPQSPNLASIIRGYKIGVTKNARKTDVDFEWQSRFYDHIIRNNKS